MRSDSLATGVCAINSTLFCEQVSVGSSKSAMRIALAQTSAVDCEAFTRSRSTPDNWLSTSLTFMLMPTAPPCNTSTMKRSKCSPASSEADRPVRSSRCRRNGCSDGRWSIQSTPHPTSLPPGWSRSAEQCQIFRGWVSWSTSLYDPFEWTDAPMPPPN